MHALDLTEILDACAVFLPAPSLRSCILVCHQWHAAFHPHLWRSVSILNSATHHPTTLHNLALNASHVQDLSLVDIDDTFDYFSLSFPRLRSLDFSFKYPLESRTFLHPGLQFWQRHRTSVQSLTLVNSRRCKEVSPWGFFRGPPSNPFCALRSLTLKFVVFPLNDLNDEARAILCQLDSLVLQEVNLTDISSNSHPPGELPPIQWRLLRDNSNDSSNIVKIRHLSMKHCNTFADEFQLMMACRQEIRSLAWHNYSRGVNSSNYGTAIVRHLQDDDGMWANLERLELNLPCLEDQDLASVMGALKCPLRELLMTMSFFGTLSAKTILEATGPRGERMHCERLEVISLCGCFCLPGAMVQRFLCECPNLEDFRAMLLSDLDIQKDPRPWVCKNLRTFLVGLSEVVTEEPATSVPFVFIERLSVLDRLEVLALMDTRMDITSVTGMFREEHDGESHELMFSKFDLHKGLDRLWRLNRLRTFRMDFSDPEVFSILEARWMVQHWPRLERVMLSKVRPWEQDAIRAVFGTINCVFHN